MKKLILCFSIIACTVIYGQTFQEVWSTSPVCSEDDYSMFVETDFSDHVIVAGAFSGSCVVDDVTLISNGGEDMFVAKYNSLGDLLWAVSFGSNPTEVPWGMDVDPLGNIYIVGRFAGNSVTFGSTTLTNAGGGSDIFLVKLDPQGNVVWAKSGNGPGNEFEVSIAVDDAGNCALVGLSTSNPIQFDSYSVSSINVKEAFIVKYNVAGDVVWVMEGNSNEDSEFNHVAFDIDNNMLVTGVVLDTFTFDGHVFIPQDVSVFVGKIGTDDHLIWGRLIAVSDVFNPPNITIDNNGNVFIAAPFHGESVLFGTDSGYEIVTCEGGFTAFTAKYDSAGNYVWGKINSDILFDINLPMSTDEAGRIYLAGSYTDSLVFGSSQFYNSSDSLNNCILILDASGVEVEAYDLGGTGEERATDIASSSAGSLYLTGFSNSNHFMFGGSQYTNNGGWDGFLVRYGKSDLHGNPTSIFPNPFMTTAVLYTEATFENASLLIYDMSGQLVTQIDDLSGTQVEIKGEHLDAGVYYIRLTDGVQTFASEKVIIIH